MNVLISGASQGLGAELVKKFLAEGHCVYAGIRSMDQLKELEAIKNAKGLTIFPMDMASPQSIEAAATVIKETVGRLDILINAAGVLLNRDDYIIHDSYEDMNATFQINTIGPLYLNNLLLGLLQQSEAGTLINITSEVLSIDGVGSKFGTYSMSKTALAQYGYILKATMNEQLQSLRVFSVHPGRMKTAMGGEYGEIEAKESADGIYRIAMKELLPGNEEIYVNYKGEAMLAR